MGIREALFLPLMLGVCGAAIFAPRLGMLAYIWYSLMRPDILAFVQDKYPVSMVLAICVGVGLLFGDFQYVPPKVLGNPFVQLLLLLQAVVFMSVLVAVNPALCEPRYSYYIRMVLVLCVMPALVRTQADMRAALLVFAVSLGYVGARFGLFGLVSGGVTLIRGYGNLGDNNFLALAVAVNLPICWACSRIHRNLVLKVGIYIVMAMSFACVIMANSRGGILSMAVALLLMVTASKHKAAALVVVAAGLTLPIYLVKGIFFNRMETLENVQADASANSRLEHIKAGIAMWKDHPILGVGFGGENYAFLVPFYSSSRSVLAHVAHNSYLQMLCDSGTLAGLLYTFLFLASIVWLSRQRKALLLERNIEAAEMARGLQIAIVTFSVGSCFYSCNRMELAYILLMLTASFWGIAKDRRKNVPALAPRAGAPVLALSTR